MADPAEDRISALPSEVLEYTFQHISKPWHLNAVCQVSRQFNTIATPILYTSLNILCPNAFDPVLAPSESFNMDELRLRNHAGIRHVHHLTLTMEYMDSFQYGRTCWHYAPKHTDEDVDSPHQGWLRLFCSQLTDNALRTFRWNLRSCVPDNILGRFGYLPRYQRKISTLELITVAGCDRDNSEFWEGYDLSAFRNIHRLAWYGPQYEQDYKALRDCFMNNADHLQSLVLDITSYPTLDPLDPSVHPEYFTIHTLGFDRAGSFTDRTIILSTLRSLSLSNISMETVAAEFVAAFNILHLYELSISHCFGSEGVLALLVDTPEVIPLESFAFTCFSHHSIQQPGPAIIQLLQKAPGLQKLSLNLDAAHWPGIPESIGLNHPFLRNVSLHSRTIYSDPDDPWSIEETDSGDEFRTALRSLFTNETCELLALSVDPKSLRIQAESYAGDVKCKLLHLRCSMDSLLRLNRQGVTGGQQLGNFANWAFGPHGFPHLRVIAYGDFAFEQICQDFNFLYRRNDLPPVDEDECSWALLTPNDEELWGWIQDSKNFLAACPYEGKTYV